MIKDTFNLTYTLYVPNPHRVEYFQYLSYLHTYKYLSCHVILHTQCMTHHQSTYIFFFFLNDLIVLS